MNGGEHDVGMCLGSTPHPVYEGTNTNLRHNKKPSSKELKELESFDARHLHHCILYAIGFSAANF